MNQLLQSLILLAGIVLAVLLWLKPAARSELLELLGPLQAHASSSVDARDHQDFAPEYRPQTAPSPQRNPSPEVEALFESPAPVEADSSLPPAEEPLAGLSFDSTAGFAVPLGAKPPNARALPPAPPPLEAEAPELLDAPDQTQPAAAPLVPVRSPSVSPSGWQPSAAAPQFLAPTPVVPLAQGTAFAQMPAAGPVQPAVYAPGFDPPPPVSAPAAPPEQPLPQSVMPAPVGPAAPPPAPAMPTAPVAAPVAEVVPQPGVEAAPAEVPTSANVLDSATIVARIDGEVVLAGEVLGPISRFFAQQGNAIPAEQVEQARVELARQRVAELVEIKLIYSDARRSIPKDNFPKLEAQVDKHFENAELPHLLEQHNVATAAQLDAVMQSQGDTLEATRRRFREMYIARGWMSEKTKDHSEVTHDDMLAFYKEHEAEYHFPAQARWEQLTVRFDQTRDRAEARRKIAWMGNQVVNGTPWAEIARAHSGGPTADEGGQRDWTTKASLRSQVLDQALFALPVGGMSPILEDESGLHIIRVIERRDAGQTPLGDAQAEIEKKIKQRRGQSKQEEYLSRLRSQAQIWTIFDEPNGALFFARQPVGTRTR
ncbi:MAG: peptidyl-prolyl cis-trans isomerase [Pirellulales bacterium]|nr:peptidyl-prolyl cis-trans isomerase [Pirellulales bacterium]